MVCKSFHQVAKQKYQILVFRLGDMPSLVSHKRAGYVCLCGGEFISLKSALHLVLCVAAVVEKSLLFTLYFNNKFRDIYDVFCGKMVLLNWLSF